MKGLFSLYKLNWMFFVLLSFTFFQTGLCFGEGIYLRENLSRARAGDYLVTAQNKNYTVFHIYGRSPSTLTVEEITVPAQKMKGCFTSWKDWVMKKAPGNTSWVMYTIDLSNAQILRYYSFTKRNLLDMSNSNNFLTTLLNLHLERVPYEKRRRVGPPPLYNREDRRALWQPRIVVEGNEVPNVAFEAWQTRWPKDGSDLSGKIIEVYVPRENERYPSYFPYWLQISGIIGSAKIRIIDSGSQMDSPMPPLGG